MEDRIKFERSVNEAGGSLTITIPSEVATYLELNKGDKVYIVGENKSKGKFASFWKKKVE